MIYPSPKTASSLPAKLRIKAAAFDLFHEKGVHATSVDEILTLSEAGKSQFYHYFKSKDGLIHELLQDQYQNLTNQEHEDLKPIKSWKDLKAFLLAPAQNMEIYNFERGCPIGTIASTLSHDDELLRQDINLILNAWKTYPKDFFIRERSKKKIKKSADPEVLADLCLSFYQGGLLILKIDRNITMYEEKLAQFLKHLKETYGKNA